MSNSGKYLTSVTSNVSLLPTLLNKYIDYARRLEIDVTMIRQDDKSDSEIESEGEDKGENESEMESENKDEMNYGKREYSYDNS